MTRIGYHGASLASSMRDSGAWPLRSIMQGLARRLSDVGETERNRERVIVSGVDRLSGVRMAAVMSLAPGDASSVVQMIYISGFSEISISEQKLNEIERRVNPPAGVSFIEYDASEGVLFIYAGPRIVGNFDESIFLEQLDLFLNDVRTVLSELLAASGAYQGLANDAKEALKAFSSASLNSIAPAVNEGSLAGAFFGAVAPCPDCKGKGRRLIRKCKSCEGTGRA